MSTLSIADFALFALLIVTLGLFYLHYRLRMRRNNGVSRSSKALRTTTATTAVVSLISAIGKSYTCIMQAMCSQSGLFTSQNNGSRYLVGNVLTHQKAATKAALVIMRPHNRGDY